MESFKNLKLALGAEILLRLHARVDALARHGPLGVRDGADS